MALREKTAAKTEASTSRNPHKRPPNINIQQDCPLFKLPPELRNDIYAYTFSPSVSAPTNGHLPPVELDKLAITAPSTALLATCRLVAQETVGIFRQGYTTFWKSHSTFSITLSDDWEDGQSRAAGKFTVPELLDETQLCPEIRVGHLSAMKHLIIIVKSDLGDFEAHLRAPVRDWSLQRIDTNNGTSPVLSLADHLLRRTVREEREAFGSTSALTLLPLQRTLWSYLATAEDHSNAIAKTSVAVSGRCYDYLSAVTHLRATVDAKRLPLAAKPHAQWDPKRRQLEASLQHCWIVFRARRRGA